LGHSGLKEFTGYRRSFWFSGRKSFGLSENLKVVMPFMTNINMEIKVVINKCYAPLEFY
jgi:cystathionine beta-lyase family protein involved in aluminum resistance